MSIRVMSTVWEQSDQSGSSLLLLLALADHADDDGYCWPTTKHLAKKIRMSVRTVIRMVGALEQEGELHVIHSRRNNRYIVRVGFDDDHVRRVLTTHNYPIPDNLSYDNLARVKLSPQKCQSVTSEVTQLCHPNHQEPSMNHQKDTPADAGDLAAELFPERPPTPTLPADGHSVLDHTDPLSMIAHCAEKRQGVGGAPDWAMVGAEGVHPFYQVVAAFCAMTGQDPARLKSKRGKAWLTKYETVARDEGFMSREMVDAHRFIPDKDRGAWFVEHHQWLSPFKDGYLEQLIDVTKHIQAGTLRQQRGVVIRNG